ncbi:MAG: hypothetical protein ACM30F_06850, partial [Nitrospirota bacterium]
DLRVIARSFNLILTGIFHHRIDYPGKEFFGEKKRGEHQDKKQPEEPKAGNGSAQKKTAEAVTERRPS